MPNSTAKVYQSAHMSTMAASTLGSRTWSGPEQSILLCAPNVLYLPNLVLVESPQLETRKIWMDQIHCDQHQPNPVEND